MKRQKTIHKLALLTSLNILLPILIIEILAAAIAKERIRRINPFYLTTLATSLETLGRGYPRNYFEAHKTRGFDIKKNSTKLYTSLPKEIPEPYAIWGNSIGCYDTDIKDSEQYSIYMAGDSFTWGYTPYEHKFGTLLEKQLNKNIAACGVTHTGTLHQLSKFKEIRSTSKTNPKKVIVNFYANDIDNDFFYPHSTILEGYQVDTRKGTYPSEGNAKIIEISKEKLTKKIMNLQNSIPQRWHPLRWSAIASTANHLAQEHQRKKENNNSDNCVLFSIYNLSRCHRKVHKSPENELPIDSPIATSTRQAIKSWIADAKANNYLIYFSALDMDWDSHNFCKFITVSGSTCWSFNQYLEDNKIDPAMTTWKRDKHLSPAGNKHYANFLFKKLQETGR